VISYVDHRLASGEALQCLGNETVAIAKLLHLSGRLTPEVLEQIRIARERTARLIEASRLAGARVLTAAEQRPPQGVPAGQSGRRAPRDAAAWSG